MQYLQKGNLKECETVFIPGAGSGVATYLISFAKNIGARVIVTSRSEDKRQQALALGADLALDTNGDWKKELEEETIDLVIESVGRATFNRSLEVLKKGGAYRCFRRNNRRHCRVRFTKLFLQSISTTWFHYGKQGRVTRDDCPY